MPKSELLNDVGKRLRSVREAAGLGVREFGYKHQISPSLWSALENGRKTLYLETFTDLCVKLDLSPTWVLTGFGKQKLSDIPGSIGARVASLNEQELATLDKLLTSWEAKHERRRPEGEDTEVNRGSERQGAGKTRKRVGGAS